MNEAHWIAHMLGHDPDEVAGRLAHDTSLREICSDYRTMRDQFGHDPKDKHAAETMRALMIEIKERLATKQPEEEGKTT